jgi:2-keto-4-pentenoate hydratase
VGKEKVSPDHLRFGDALFSVYKDHDLVTSAPATEIMGGPLDALRWLVSFLAARGDYLKKDSWVIPGSPAALVEVDQDTELKVVIEQVGQVVAHFRKEGVNNPVHPTVLRTASDH